MFGTASLSYPPGTKATASFATADNSGLDKLIDKGAQAFVRNVVVTGYPTTLEASG